MVRFPLKRMQLTGPLQARIHKRVVYLEMMIGLHSEVCSVANLAIIRRYSRDTALYIWDAVASMVELASARHSLMAFSRDLVRPVSVLLHSSSGMLDLLARQTNPEIQKNSQHWTCDHAHRRKKPLLSYHTFGHAPPLNH